MVICRIKYSLVRIVKAYCPSFMKELRRFRVEDKEKWSFVQPISPCALLFLSFSDPLFPFLRLGRHGRRRVVQCCTLENSVSRTVLKDLHDTETTNRESFNGGRIEPEQRVRSLMKVA